MLFSPEADRRPRAVAAVLALACAVVLALPAASPAEALEREHSMDIEATVDDPSPAPDPVVIKVEVPASTSAVDIFVRTSVLDGRFLGFEAADTSIRNLPDSTAPISAVVSAVSDGADGKAKVLPHLSVALTGDRTVELSEAAGGRDVLVERLEPGSTIELGVSVEERTKGQSIPVGAYGMAATIKIAAT